MCVCAHVRVLQLDLTDWQGQRDPERVKTVTLRVYDSLDSKEPFNPPNQWLITLVVLLYVFLRLVYNIKWIT